MGFGDRIRHAWNAFVDRDPVDYTPITYGGSYGTRPDRLRVNLSNERSLIASVYARLSIDVAGVSIRHVRLDSSERFVENISSGVDSCLNVEANIDQAGRAFRQDIALSLFDAGCIAIVPVDTTLNPKLSGGYDVKTMRVGTITQWFPQHVRVSLYNEQTGRREEVTLPKTLVAIIENPLYSVMNEPNSTLQRLIRKLNLLDAVDEQSGSGKLDLIIQLPYVVKTEGKRLQAEQRRKDIEVQLKDSRYGIAYTDGTEKVTQLNRPAENNLMSQIEYLVTLLYSQLGLTEEVMNGTADEKAMLNYYNRTVEPVLDAIVEAMTRTFLTKTARSQGQSIQYFRDPFKLMPLADIAELADKLTRNEIASSNEIRQIFGWKPSNDPKADQLRNSNMPQSELGTPPPDAAPADSTQPADTTAASDGSDPTAALFDEVNGILDKTFADLGVEG